MLGLRYLGLFIPPSSLPPSLPGVGVVSGGGGGGDVNGMRMERCSPFLSVINNKPGKQNSGKISAQPHTLIIHAHCLTNLLPKAVITNRV